MIFKINQFTNEFGIKQVDKDPASEVEGKWTVDKWRAHTKNVSFVMLW